MLFFRHYSEHSVNMNLFNLQHPCEVYPIITPTWQMKTLSTERSSNLPKVTQLLAVNLGFEQGILSIEVCDLNSASSLDEKWFHLKILHKLGSKGTENLQTFLFNLDQLWAKVWQIRTIVLTKAFSHQNHFVPFKLTPALFSMPVLTNGHLPQCMEIKVVPGVSPAAPVDLSLTG